MPDVPVQLNAPVDLNLADLAATTRLASALARMARPGDMIALHGDLGAGKTAFARAFIQTAMEMPVEVPSPTFNLVLTYAAPVGTIWHFDLYRLRSEGELTELGLDDALADGISLVEWPDRLGPLMPRDALHLHLCNGTGGQDHRHVLLDFGKDAGGSWAGRLEHLDKAGIEHG